MAFLDSTGLAHLWSELKAKLNAKANASHTHALSGPTITGTLPVSKGGTGGTTQSAARSGLGLGRMATKSSVDLTGSDVTGALPISKGGTGAETADAARTNLGLGALAEKDSAALGEDVTGVLPTSYGGTGAATPFAAIQALFSVGDAAGITTYPTAPGIYRTTNTKVCTNYTGTISNYGVLVIFRAVYAMHIYLAADGTLIYGYSGDTFQQPTVWNKVTPT